MTLKHQSIIPRIQLMCAIMNIGQEYKKSFLHDVKALKSAAQIAITRKLPCPVQLCANVLVLTR